jgi:hypothetical protein
VFARLATDLGSFAARRRGGVVVRPQPSEIIMLFLRSALAAAAIMFASGCASTLEAPRATSAGGIGAYGGSWGPRLPEPARPVDPAPASTRLSVLELPPRPKIVAASRFDSVVRKGDCSLCQTAR